MKMLNINIKNLIIYKIIFAKKIRLIKYILSNLFKKINNLIIPNLLNVVKYIKLNVRYKI